MAFDGIISRSVLFELNATLKEGKINKVYQPNKNEIILGIYANGKNYALAICIDSNTCRFHLTTHAKPNPLSAPNFCMLLRKHLLGMRIASFSMVDLERIITIDLQGFDELNDFVHKKLVLELMGKHSNIILVNENNRIIDSMRHLDTFSNATRTILPAHEYILPSSDKSSLLQLQSSEEFIKLVSAHLTTCPIDTAITNTFTGISKITIHSLLKKLSLPVSTNNQTLLSALYPLLKDLLSHIDSNCISCQSYQDMEKSKEDYCLVLKEKETALDINFFLDDFYYQKETLSEFTTYRNSVLKLILNEVKKYTKRLENMNQKLEECNKMDLYRLYGELITANLYKIKEENSSSITLENYYENNQPITIPLDNTIPISYNAKKYFKKYSKLKNALAIVTKQKEETAKEISYLESIVYELEQAKTILEIDSIYQEISETILSKTFVSKNTKKTSKNVKKKLTPIGDPIELTLNNFTIYIGKNNKQNDYLTLKVAHSNDLWFHTKTVHGSHVILKTEGKEVPQELINRCASLAAYYSKASLSSNVPVDYTYARYVKKPSGSKPGMVIYTNYMTVNVNPKNEKEELD